MSYDVTYTSLPTLTPSSIGYNRTHVPTSSTTIGDGDQVIKTFTNVTPGVYLFTFNAVYSLVSSSTTAPLWTTYLGTSTTAKIASTSVYGVATNGNFTAPSNLSFVFSVSSTSTYYVYHLSNHTINTVMIGSGNKTYISLTRIA